MSTRAPRSLLILRLSAFGDILHTLPAVALLREAMPETRLGWVVEEAFRDLVELSAGVHEVFVVATKRWRRELIRGETWSELGATRHRLIRFADEGMSIDFQGLVKSAVLGVVGRAPVRYGFDRNNIRERAAQLFINRPIAVDPNRHVVEMNVQLARAVSGSTAPLPAVDLQRYCSSRNGQLDGLAAESMAILNPGAGHPSKRWPAERFAEISLRIRSELGLGSVVVWGPGEQFIAKKIADSGGAVLAPETNLRELAFLLRHAKVVVSGDSGPLHLAAALGTRVVGLYGPTNPARNGPWGQPGQVVGSRGGDKRMEEISVETVFAKLKETLQ